MDRQSQTHIYDEVSMVDNTARTAHGPDEIAPSSRDPEKLFAIGRHLLEKRKCKEASVVLKEVVALAPGEALYQSYYGLSLVETGRDREGGVDLCRQSVRKLFYRVDPFINLARAYFLIGDRKRAVRALEKGSVLELGDPIVEQLMSELGRRRKPVFPFLRRDHPINRVVGRIRHVLLGSSQWIE